jgi:iron complex transport system permease protein
VSGVLRLGPVSRRFSPRDAGIAAALLLLVAVLTLLGLSLGERPVSADRVLAAFLPDAEALDRMVVVEWRAPRAFAAAVFGACLGISGGLFQALTRNPLGSPDIIGLNTGAYSGVLCVILLGGSGYAAFAAGAVGGGVLAAGLVYLLAYSSGLQGFRLIVVGIAVSAFLSSANSWFVVKANLDEAMRAAVWGAGTLNGIRWPQLLAAGTAALVLLCVLPWLSRRIAQLELGEDAARVRGVRAEPVKAVLVLVGVALTALVTAVTGPIAFIALAAPQIARRIRRETSGFDAVGAALVGAVLLSGADLLAQHALPIPRSPWAPSPSAWAAPTSSGCCSQRTGEADMSHTPSAEIALQAVDLTAGYRSQDPVLRAVAAAVPRGGFTAVIGPNGCGKSTLLRAFTRLLAPASGGVLLDGRDISALRTAALARRMSMLPQQSPVPDGIRVAELVRRGRYPHQTLFAQWSADDEAAVARAMELTRVSGLADRLVDTLSGGQRQRVWIALALAQDTELLLLDEPTTFLDIAHQYETLRLLQSLQAQGRTVVAVLHDLDHAARFATHVVAMRDGRTVASGTPAEILTEERVREVFGLDCRILADPDTGTPVVLPR